VWVEPLTTYLYKHQINMTFEEYQSVARTTAIYPNKGSNLYYPALGLGEVGEIQNNIKKVYRDDEGILTDQRKQDIKKECGDVLWYLSALADECGFTLQEVAEENLAKLLSRQLRNQLQGSGDHR
jgi:NTP pyrophosphatase (non-canonical NTP hydrolase)